MYEQILYLCFLLCVYTSNRRVPVFTSTTHVSKLLLPLISFQHTLKATFTISSDMDEMPKCG